MEEKLRVHTHLMVKAVVGMHCDPCRRQRRRELWVSCVQPGALSTPANYAEDTMSELPACRSGAFSTPRAAPKMTSMLRLPKCSLGPSPPCEPR
jgi:hypothetical protein